MISRPLLRLGGCAAVGYHALGVAPDAAQPLLAELTERYLPRHALRPAGGTVDDRLRRLHRRCRLLPYALPRLDGGALAAPRAAQHAARGRTTGPDRGYVRPIHGTLVWTLFFLMSTAVAWNLGTGGGAQEQRA
jgi:hypothetical protein